ncbi:putative head closure protein [Citrobacter phage CVT22]|uniref:Head closure protein n=1 Tax=Citrobacter phage CVT22 TaxID=1622234 RepID=A0A0R6CA37_9CAUD|nr:tail appendage [Citrobacter phage CVT22]AJT60716.1 putative head closure protein [Citrobacter phage CVT22]
MAVQSAAQEVNSFSKGIITEASPLSFPDNASINENNLVIENDGSRRRRFGMDYEPQFVTRNTNQLITADLAFASFSWKAPGGYSDIELLVVQVGSQLFMFNSTMRPVSGSLVYSADLGIASNTTVSFAASDGLLVVASTTATIRVYDWDGTTVVPSTGRLLIRDLFGVSDVVSGNNLLEGSGVAFRPATTTSAHTYNLRNQTFAVPRFNETDEILYDPIYYFQLKHGVYQSNSDNLVVYLYADPNQTSDRNTRRYFAQDNFANPLGTFRAPVGYFIIDALDRGASRMSEIGKLHAQYPQLVATVTSLPTDRTPDGASVVTSFAGRVWFSGFSSKIIGGDSESPRMGSYVLFSKLVKSPSDVYKCYQDGDPTSAEAPDLLDTDGGFIRLDGANNIQKLINVGDSLIVVAENGVWRVTGGSGYGFKATDYLTSKVTEHGSVSPEAVVVVDNTIMFWSEDGIYHLAPNQYGDWVATSLTTNTIQSLYDNIPYNFKIRAKGLFDSYQRRVRWIYSTELVAGVEAQELVLDVNLGAFYTASVAQIPGLNSPKPVSLVRVPPFTIGTEDTSVIDMSSNTVVDSLTNTVVVSEEAQISAISELLYVTSVPSVDGLFKFTFSYYYDTGFRDWRSHNNIGIDAKAFLITGWTGFGDFQRMKQIPYLTIYSIKTETGFDTQYNPINPSSVLVQSQWSWSNSASSGKWSPQFQAYRHKRLWFPEDNLESFDDGDLVVKTRNKLRGRGSVLSLKFDTEPDKDFHVLGWSYTINVNGKP